MYLKLGRIYALVVCISALSGIELGNEELITETLWYGYHTLAQSADSTGEIGTDIAIHPAPSEKLFNIRS